MPGPGHLSYVGIAKEATWGTFVASTEFLEHLSETIDAKFTEKVMQGINNSRVQTKRVRGAKTVAGEVQFEVNVEDAIGHLLKGLLPTEGLIDDGAGNGGQHAFTPGQALPAGLSMQVARPSNEDGSFSAGNVRDYFGGRVTSLAFEAALDEVLKGTGAMTFKDETSGSGVTPTYTTQTPLVYHTGTITTDGSPVAISAFTLTVASGMKAERRKIGSNLIQQQLPGMYDVTGQVVIYYDDMVHVNKFLNNTPAAIVLDLTGPSVGTTVRRLKFEIPVAFYNGETPKVSGRDAEVMVTVPFRAIKDGSGSPNELLKITLANSRRTAY